MQVTINKNTLSFTGERIVPEATNCEPHFAEKMRQEHICRYYFASQFAKSKRILDVGCGVGYGSKLLAQQGAAQVVAFDLDAGTIEHAKEFYCHQNVQFHCASAIDFDFGEGAFDVVTCFELIEHVSNQQAVIRHIARALAPEGLLLISSPRPLLKKRTDFHTSELHLNAFRQLVTESFPHARVYSENNHFTSLISGDPPPEFVRPKFMREQFSPELADYFVCVASKSPLDTLAVAPEMVVNDDNYVLLLEHDVVELRRIESQLNEMLREHEKRYAVLAQTIYGPTRAPFLPEAMKVIHLFLHRVSRLKQLARKFFTALRYEGVSGAVTKTKYYLTKRSVLFADKLGAPGAVSQMRSESVDVLFVSGCPGHSQRYRVDNIADGLRELGHTVHVIPGHQVNTLLTPPYPKVAVFFRIADSVFFSCTPVIRHLQQQGVSVFCDNDDLVFEPEIVSNLGAASALTPLQLEEYRRGTVAVRDLMTHCDAGTASTSFLAARMSAVTGKVHVIPNSVNKAQIEAADALLQAPVKKRQSGIRLIYGSGTLTHNKDFEQCAPAIRRFLKERPQALLVVVGQLELPACLDEFSGQIIVKPMMSYLDLLDETAEADINLAPLEITPFNHAKSELKIFEAALVMVPTIASPTDSYAKCIENGVDGILAATEYEWYQALNRLADDAALRESMGTAIREKSLARFHYLPAARLAAEAYGLPPKRQNAATEEYALPANPDIDHLRIAWILPNLMANSGGHRNILRTAYFLSKFGHRVEIYVMNTVENSAQLQQHIHKYYYPIVCDVFPYNGSIRKNDAVFATHWSTVQALQDNRSACRETFYFVQDFEPYFVPMSSEFIAAENTYKQGLHPITSGPWCAHILKKEYGVEADYFLFPVDRNIYYPRPRTKKEKNLVFFAKPEMPRRCYELGVAALKEFYSLRPDVEIIFFGSSQVSTSQVPFPFTYNAVLPKLDDLAALYANADVGLVFSTTNPSLIPYEMMACGLPVVDINRGDSHYNYGERRDIALLADPRPEIMAKQMARLMNNAEDRERRRRNGLEFVAQFPSEEEMARLVETYIKKRLTAGYTQ